MNMSALMGMLRGVSPGGSMGFREHGIQVQPGFTSQPTPMPAQSVMPDQGGGFLQQLLGMGSGQIQNRGMRQPAPQRTMSYAGGNPMAAIMRMLRGF